MEERCLVGAGIGWVESRLGLVEGRSLEEGSGAGGGLVPCLEACQVELVPFGSCCFPAASAEPVLKQGRMSVVVGGTEEGFEQVQVRSLRKLNCLGVHRIRDRTCCRLEFVPRTLRSSWTSPLDFVAYATVPKGLRQDAHVNRTSTG